MISLSRKIAGSTVLALVALAISTSIVPTASAGPNCPSGPCVYTGPDMTCLHLVYPFLWVGVCHPADCLGLRATVFGLGGKLLDQSVLC